jgi:hypothetical protein
MVLRLHFWMSNLLKHGKLSSSIFLSSSRTRLVLETGEIGPDRHRKHRFRTLQELRVPVVSMVNIMFP